MISNNLNKRNAVRVTHLPTGITVVVDCHQAMHKNKADALNILKSKLYMLNQEVPTEEIRYELPDDIWGANKELDEYRDEGIEQV